MAARGNQPGEHSQPEEVLPRYGVELMRDVRIPTADAGVTLSADLFLPVGAGAVPALVTVLPYRKDGPAGIGAAANLRWFAARGYASMLVDFRGTGSSDGHQRPPFDPNEAEDGVVAVEWAARQPWCTGNVGMWGASYGAVMAMRTASRRPPHLKAIVPIMGALDLERDLVHPGGNHGCLAAVASWSVRTLINQLLPPLEGFDTPEQQRRWQRRLRDMEPWLLDLFRHGPGHPVWRSRLIDETAIDVPTFCIAGWRDLFCEATIRAYECINAPKKLLVGPWMHTTPDISPFEAVDQSQLLLRWWDRWLTGGDNGVMDEPAITLYEQGRSPQWRQFTSWPPAGKDAHFATTTGTALRASSTVPALERHLERDDVIAEYQPDPTVGPLSGLWGFPTTGFGLPPDQHEDDMRSLTVTSDALPHDLVITGRPQAFVSIALGSTVIRVIGRLTDVDPDGRSTLITMGITSDLPPSGICEVAMAPTSYRVPSGHRIRVALSDADFPRLWPAEAHPGSQEHADVLRVVGVAVTLPTIEDSEGETVTLPAADPTDPERPAFAVRARPLWNITRDRIDGGVTVAFGQELESHTPNQEHLLELTHEMSATVRRSSPATARVHGVSTGLVKMATGEEVLARVELHMSRESMTAEGRVDIDGITTFSRQWNL